MTQQPPLFDAGPPPRVDPRPTTYWENRGPRDWRPVTLLTRYGTGPVPTPHPQLPEVRTKSTTPRNVAIRREDGHERVVPIRSLRRCNPYPPTEKTP